MNTFGSHCIFKRIVYMSSSIFSVSRFSNLCNNKPVKSMQWYTNGELAGTLFVYGIAKDNKRAAE